MSLFTRFLFATLALPLSMSAETPQLPRLFVIGDSISIQYGPYLEKRVAGTFAYDRKQDAAGAPRATSNLDVPIGANGGDSDMVLAYLRHRRAHDPVRADILLLNCGLHDIKTTPSTGAIQVPLERYRANLLAIIEETRAMHLRLVWIRTTPVFDETHNSRSQAFHRFARDVDAYNAAADAIMAAANAPAIDLNGFSAKFLPAGFIDHVHYREEIREKQAAFIFDELRRLLTPVPPATGIANPPMIRTQP